MKTSIAMATYNGATYLREQLDSLVHQTRLPDELVISDDCSTDDTWRLIKAFAVEAPFPVHARRNDTNLGYAGNFEKALGRCAGDLIFLCDQDDVWFLKKIESIAALAESDRHNMVFMNDAEITNEALVATGLTKLGQIRAAGMPNSAFVMGCCAAIRKEFVDICLPIPAAYGSHDSWIMTMADGIGRRRIVEEPMQQYRRHRNNKSQMVANRSEKLTMAGYLLDRARAVRRIGSTQSITNSLARTRMLRKRVQSLAFGNRQGHDSLCGDFTEYLETLKQKEEAAERRLGFCSKPRIARLGPAFKLYAQGQYDHFTGITSLLRDILFK